ncbi:DUF4190 domain-containing protein [Bacillus sp. IB182487]|uniref:DUF4190 domain-containing protein n=1 Tax=Metabacillus arenae TaxID=2771434 RepID=A0A926NI67_9BACI|nr:DUF4190 domain-containing protein [Metabacillus arenae]
MREYHDYRGTSFDRDNEYMEETAAEVAAPVGVNQGSERQFDGAEEKDRPEAGEGRRTGFIALALSIVSLFILPVILGAAGIIVGFIARRRGAEGLGGWAIGIGAVSIILGIFVQPFF